MNKILVVIDMQNDFIDGALGTKEAVQIVPNVLAKIGEYAKLCKDGTAHIFLTQDTHEKNYLQTQEGKNLPVEHCIRGTVGWQIQKEIAAIAARLDAQIIEKPAFGSVKLAEAVASVASDSAKAQTEIQIEIVGLCTDICVVSNALILKAALPEANICVDSNCCAGVTPEKHTAALETMKSCQIKVV